MTKKNILIITDKLDYHGASINGPARYFSWLLKEIDKNKFNVWLCSLRKKGPSHELFEGTNMLYLGHHKYYPFSFLAIVRLIRENNIDLLHLSGYASATFGRLAAIYTKTPVVIQEHWVDPNFGGIVKLVEKILVNYTTCAIAISLYSKNFLVQKKGIPEEKVHVVVNGIPLEIFYSARKQSGLELKKKLGLSASKKVVGIVGMLHENKGHILFVDAAAEVLEKHKDVYFVIVGEGELRDKLTAYIEGKKLQKNVIMVGQQDDMAAILQMLDIFSMCSYSETAPLSLLEAMASGVAIVTTDCGGPSELIESGKNGLVVPIGDSRAIAHSILSLLDDEDLAKSFGKQVAKDSERYDIRGVARSLEKIYLDIV